VDVRRTALVGEPVGDLGPSSEGTVEITRDDPGLIEVETRTLDRQLLVLSESYSSGWHAAEDGRDVPIHRAYGDLQACVVSSGTHRVVFRFSPRSFEVGWRLSAGGLGLLAISHLIWFRFVRRRVAPLAKVVSATRLR
jgi:uncharacterized membrane protein YfhO